MIFKLHLKSGFRYKTTNLILFVRLGNQKLVLNVVYSDIEIYIFLLFLRRRVSQQFENMHQFLDEKAAQVITYF